MGMACANAIAFACKSADRGDHDFRRGHLGRQFLAKQG